jgi:hypothetical protein
MEEQVVLVATAEMKLATADQASTSLLVETLRERAKVVKAVTVATH